MKRRLAALLLAAALLAGCRGARQRVIAVIPKGTDQIFWQSIQAGAVAAGRDLHVEVLWNGPAQETEYSRQIQILDSVIARHVDGIAISAADRVALNASLDRAAAAGIPVVVFDSGVDTSSYMTFLATNNAEAGEKGARKLAELLGGRGKIGLLLHAPGSNSTMERERRFEEVLTAEFPGLEIVQRQYGMAEYAKARAAAENMLTAHPDLRAFFASSESTTVGGALAIKGRDLAGKVHLVGFDYSESQLADLRGGVIDALIVQDPFRIGYDSVKLLVDRLNGGPAPAKLINLSAQVITRPDLDRPEIRTLLFRDLRPYLGSK